MSHIAFLTGLLRRVVTWVWGYISGMYVKTKTRSVFDSPLVMLWFWRVLYKTFDTYFENCLLTFTFYFTKHLTLTLRIVFNVYFLSYFNICLVICSWYVHYDMFVTSTPWHIFDNPKHWQSSQNGWNLPCIESCSVWHSYMMNLWQVIIDTYGYLWAPLEVTKNSDITARPICTPFRKRLTYVKISGTAEVLWINDILWPVSFRPFCPFPKFLRTCSSSARSFAKFALPLNR